MILDRPGPFRGPAFGFAPDLEEERFFRSQRRIISQVFLGRSIRCPSPSSTVLYPNLPKFAYRISGQISNRRWENSSASSDSMASNRLFEASSLRLGGHCSLLRLRPDAQSTRRATIADLTLVLAKIMDPIIRSGNIVGVDF